MTAAVTNSRLDNVTYMPIASILRRSADQLVLVCDIVLFLSNFTPLYFFSFGEASIGFQNHYTKLVFLQF